MWRPGDAAIDRARKGERAGWTWGWIVGFAWVAILGLVFLAQGSAPAGGMGILIFLAAVLTTQRLAPWRHPRAPYWRLMAALYALFLLSAAWAVWAFGGLEALELDAWMLLWLVPAFLPVLTHGRRTWDDGHGPAGSAS